MDSQNLLEVREAADAAVLLLPRDEEEARGVSSGCPQLAGNFSSHLLWTETPHALQVFPCLLRPHMDAYDPFTIGTVRQGKRTDLTVTTCRRNGEGSTLELMRVASTDVVSNSSSNGVNLSLENMLGDLV